MFESLTRIVIATRILFFYILVVSIVTLQLHNIFHYLSVSNFVTGLHNYPVGVLCNLMACNYVKSVSVKSFSVNIRGTQSLFHTFSPCSIYRVNQNNPHDTCHQLESVLYVCFYVHLCMLMPMNLSCTCQVTVLTAS